MLLFLGTADTPFGETGLRNFLMSQFPASPKCLEKYSSASDLRKILRPYFAQFISTNSLMRLECSHCRLEATNFWEHVYMMHLKVGCNCDRLSYADMVASCKVEVLVVEKRFFVIGFNVEPLRTLLI